MNNQKVWVKVTNGYRLPKPAGCDDAIYAKMFECWNADASKRPKFFELAVFFRGLVPGFS